jgi:poly(A) polymerase
MNSKEEKAESIVKTLVEAGYEAYYAGGWVRDYLLKRSCDDIDIATSATPEVIQSIFQKTVPVGVQFGVVLVVVGDDSFEVTTFRNDGAYTDGRKPDSVTYSSAKEDALRRDFTINGLFYDPIKGEVLDYVEGRKDIKDRRIRAIGSVKERFQEDKLRLIRAIRFSCRLDFSIEKETRQAIIEQASTLLPAVSMERIWQEFQKMRGATFVAALQQMHTFGLLQVIFPKLKRYSSDNFYELSAPMEFFPKDCPTILYLVDLFPYASLKDWQEIAEYLKVSNKDKAVVADYWYARKLIQKGCLEKRSIELVEWARFYAQPLSYLFLDMVASRMGRGILKEHMERRATLESHVRRIQNKTPLIKGDDLRLCGVPPGRRMGMLLKEAERISINQNILDPELVIKKLQRTAIWIGDDFSY